MPAQPASPYLSLLANVQQLHTCLCANLHEFDAGLPPKDACCMLLSEAFSLLLSEMLVEFGYFFTH